jgi:transketolase
VPPYAPWRQLIAGNGPVVIAVGPLAGIYIEAFERMDTASRPNFWVVAELPIERNPLPAKLLEQLGTTSLLCVAEEHVRRGSFASELTLHMADHGIPVPRLVHLHARAHHYKRYGSQPFLRGLSSLDASSMMAVLNSNAHG